MVLHLARTNLQVCDVAIADVGELSMAEVSAEHKCKATDKDLAWRKALNCNP